MPCTSPCAAAFNCWTHRYQNVGNSAFTFREALLQSRRRHSGQYWCSRFLPPFRVKAGSTMLWGTNRIPHQAGTYRAIEMSPNYGTQNLEDLCQINPLMSANACAWPAALHTSSCRIISPFSRTRRLSAGCRPRRSICRASLQEHSQLVFQELLLFVFQQVCLPTYLLPAFCKLACLCMSS